MGSPRVELINTGTELLLGNVVNTHLAWLGQELFSLGLRIERQTTVPDGFAIRDALCESLARGADIVFVTGGLGPTEDDITRELCAELFGVPLKESEEVLNHIRERLARRGIALRESMKKQSLVPGGAEVLQNPNGTAPGLYFPPAITARAAQSAAHVFLLPGPPRELRPMVHAEVLPRLRAAIAQFSESAARREMRVYRVCGMGESAVEELIGQQIAREGEVEVGYCARPNEVDFRLIAPPHVLDRWEPMVREVLGANLFATGNVTMETTVVELLRAAGKSLATAESCTGGLLANRVTNVPGASAVFLCGFVTYANEAKIRLLGVDGDLIARKGAVSAEVAAQMAEGARCAGDADFALSTTGIAGPDGGTAEKPVGTVFFGLAERGCAPVAWRACYPADRETFKQLATQAALDALRRRLLGVQNGH